MSDRLRRMIELARAHVERGEKGPAGVYYRLIVNDTSPPKSGMERIAHGEACLWYARMKRSQNKLGAAADWYYQAVTADPLAVDYRVEYCIHCLIPMGLLKDARIEAERATRIDPESKDAWRALGGVEHKLGNVEASIAAYDRQMELAPDDANAKLDRATIALDTADYAMVRALCEPLLTADRSGDALHCLAMADYREGRHEQALELYDKAIAAECYDPALARWNKSLALHSIGRYLEGWAEHEQRGEQKTDVSMAVIMKRFDKKWNGEPPPARLHIHQEMGHGDVIAMARYVPILIERGYDVRLEVNDAMVGLMQRSFPGARVMAKAMDYPAAMGVPAFDYHIPMLSLPAMFGTGIDTVPWPGTYLRADPELVENYRKKLPAGFKAGLCWSSGIRHDGIWLAEYGRRKSIPFNALMPVIKAARCSLASLQVGPERRERRDPVLDLLPDKPSWDDTAALIECLDLVITVDTAVAHLAGAMGKPVWVLMQRDGASWHWMCYRDGAAWNEASPWYPTARLFRQTQFNRPHYWADVIADVADELEILVRATKDTLHSSGEMRRSLPGPAVRAY